MTTAQLLEADGAQVVYLHPYSPEFNHIDICSAWLKSRIRKQLHHSHTLRDATETEAVLKTVS
ncbi:MAG: transposase [Cyanobacteriota bacterium]